MAMAVRYSTRPRVESLPLKLRLCDGRRGDGEPFRTLRVRVAAGDWGAVTEFVREVAGRVPHVVTWVDDEGDAILIDSQEEWDEATRGWAAAVDALPEQQALTHPLVLRVNIDRAAVLAREKKRAQRAAAKRGGDAGGTSSDNPPPPSTAAKREKRPVYVRFHNGTDGDLEVRWVKAVGRRGDATCVGAAPSKVYATLRPHQTYSVRTYAKQRWRFTGGGGAPHLNDFMVPVLEGTTWMASEARAGVKARAKRRPLWVLVKPEGGVRAKTVEIPENKAPPAPAQTPLSPADLAVPASTAPAAAVDMHSQLCLRGEEGADAMSGGDDDSPPPPPLTRRTSTLPDIHRSPSKFNADGSPRVFTMPESPGRRRVADSDVYLI